jgi:hypothetical protein
MNNVEENISKWDTIFSIYLDTESQCMILINEISEIKNNLKKLLGLQKPDDIVFYKSLIDNSFFYLTNSLKIRKLKMTKDLNYIWNQLDNKKIIEDLNKSNFQAFLKDYRKMADDINQAKKNNTMLTWVKDDRVESLHEIEKEMEEIMDYHSKLIQFFHSSVELEKIFYCGK